VGHEYNEKKFPVQTSSILHDGLVGAGLLSSVGQFLGLGGTAGFGSSKFQGISFG
jgi:hypothetical protein